MCLEITKLGSPIEVINQFKISYLEKLFPLNFGFIRIFIKLFVFAPIIIGALFWSWILPQNQQELYFDILVLAEKAN